MLTVLQAPQFSSATVSDLDGVHDDRQRHVRGVGATLLADFTFVCPTEIAEFGRKSGDFVDRDAQVPASVDSEFVHLAWRAAHPDLKDLPFPMVADLTRDLASGCGVLDRKAGVARRATFIVDPQGVIRFVEVTDMSVGRNPAEVLRVLDALQTDELCPCNWQKGQSTLSAA
jgi:peroxiredoxin (alkyl hydroperoxide reductase subunit C)